MAPASAKALGLAALLAALTGGQAVLAGPYKCAQPDGSVLYQQAPCPGTAASQALELDTRPPSGEAPDGPPDAFSVESQLKAMEAERAKANRERAKAEAESRKARREDRASGYDRARCAKHRAEAARWEKEASRAYRDAKDQDYKAQMLEHHRALAERWCAGE